MKTIPLSRICKVHGLDYDEVREYLQHEDVTRDEYCLIVGAFDVEAPDDAILEDYAKETGLGLFNEGGRVVVSSRIIAENFGKEHKNVIRDIKSLECSDTFNRLNFEAVKYKDAKGEMRPEYLITRQGFCFLVMGFTGKSAAAWKEKYIEAFDKMERQLTEPEALPAGDAIDYKRARFLVDGAMAFRDVMSRAARRQIMEEYYALGGVDIEENQRPITLENEIDNFIATTCVIGKGLTCSRQAFYEAFSRGADATASRTAVSRAVNALGLYPSVRIGSGRGWSGFSLK
ncbi:Rha family transcriptional regulator [Cloacibacillus evryensis]|uniref:Rha family transcriptional regulator n=1 Tax=Cloacibacillus evryensis TaxID=508460 RepID=UPI002B201624|nr:Rha family transcriptional regulator [Cloacibacillus evryensis]MEA5034213.1 Rha family transcriptional regulator [Cloacibacillus evryensis]